MSHTYRVQMHGLARLMTPVIRGWVRKNTEQAVENLLRALER